MDMIKRRIIKSTTAAPSLIQKPAYSKANSPGFLFNLGSSGRVLDDFLRAFISW